VNVAIALLKNKKLSFGFAPSHDYNKRRTDVRPFVIKRLVIMHHSPTKQQSARAKHHSFMQRPVQKMNRTRHTAMVSFNLVA
jgi:hypothetical protein